MIQRVFPPMIRRAQFGLAIVILAGVVAGWNLPRVAAQDQAFSREILARARVFPEIGPGVTALKRDAAGRYYVLAAPATAIQIYGADGKRLGQIPNSNSHGAKITYAQDIDLDAAGRLLVADRGANAIKIFEANGSLDATIRVIAPMSIAALSNNEIAVASLRSANLVQIIDASGALVRGFGEPPAAPQGASRDESLSHGRLYGDSAGHVYFAFTELPDPTIRKYDRFGYAAYEISLPASEFKPQPGEKHWTTVVIDKGGTTTSEKPVIGALGVDPETLEVWVAIGGEIVHFDKDGNRRSSYRASTKEGAPIEPTAILVEHDRLLIAGDPFGVFDFALPEPRHAAAVVQ